VPAARCLIVNADDFGRSAGVNRGIIEAHEHGIVTSASLMVRWPAAVEAAAFARGHPRLGVGLHLDLGEWTYRDECWVPLYEVVPFDDPAIVADEMIRQLEAFRSLVGRGPTHIDSHQHVHRDEPVRSIARRMARDLTIPVRHYTSGIAYCGDFYGQTAEGLAIPDALSAEALLAIVAALPPGVTELACHPGDPTDLDATMYRDERRAELRILCDPRVRAAIAEAGIELRSFGDVVRASRGGTGCSAGAR
jgi:predicted glycoside hydrolase/deacetylase ChbG (UPF0249 family)